MSSHTRRELLDSYTTLHVWQRDTPPPTPKEQEAELRASEARARRLSGLPYVAPTFSETLALALDDAGHLQEAE